MNTRYFFKGLKIDDRTRDYVEKRIKRLEKFLRNVLQMEVEINLDKKGKFRVEITVKTSHKIYRSEEVSESAETSVDIAIGELKMQIVKDKEKVGTLKERGRRSLKKKMVLDKSSRF